MRFRPLNPLGRFALAALLACAGFSSQAGAPQAAVSAGPDTPGYGDRADVDHLAQFGFTEHEYVISGLARKFKGVGTLGSDGKWAATVVSNNTPYNTMMRRSVPARWAGRPPNAAAPITPCPSTKWRSRRSTTSKTG